MSTNELEREVSKVLHRHAGDVMERTDTTKSYARFLERAEQDRRRRRAKASVAAVVATAAAAAAAVVGPGLLDRLADRPAPASEVVTAAERVALQMMEAVADHDVRAVRELLAPGAEVFGDWEAELRLGEAVGVSIDVQFCEELDSLADGTRVGCVYQEHAFHSETYGRGPFPDNSAMIQVLDGEVTRMSLERGVGDESSEHLHQEISTWLEARYPEDAELLLSGWPKPEPATPERVARYLELWELRAAEFAAEQTAR